MSGAPRPVPLSAAAQAAQRLGVLGGSFDPPHWGHLHVSRCARAAFALDHVLFVPAARPPHKPEGCRASGAERMAMLVALLAAEPSVSVWGAELERSGPSYTIDTLRELRTLVPATTRLYLILGQDNLPGFARWRGLEELVALAQPVVVLRSAGAAELDGLEQLSPFARTRIALGCLATPVCEESSTSVRTALEAGAEPGTLLPAALADYIRARGLYRST